MIQRICPYYEKNGVVEPFIHDCCNCKHCKIPMKCRHKQGRKYTIDELHTFASNKYMTKIKY